MPCRQDCSSMRLLRVLPYLLKCVCLCVREERGDEAEQESSGS